MNTPRDIVFDDTPHVMRKQADDPVFWSVRDIIMSWLRFIDDILTVYRGDQITNKGAVLAGRQSE